MVMPVADIRPNYRQLESCLTCPQVKDLLQRGTALVCNKWESWSCEANFICEDHPKFQPEEKVETVIVTKFNVPKGYKLVKRKARKKKKAAKKKVILKK